MVSGPVLTRLNFSIFRGWHIDPITLSYKYMIYDDGDKCMDNDRYSTTIELIPSNNPLLESKLYQLKKTGMCTFRTSLLTYVPEESRVASHGIHTPGVIDISSANESLPVICGKMKCRYEDVAKHVRDLSNQVLSSHKTISSIRAMIVKGSAEPTTLVTNMTLEASKDTLKLSAQVVEKSLELIHEMEDLQRSLTDDFLEREESAKKEVAEQNAEEVKPEKGEFSFIADKQDKVATDIRPGNTLLVTEQSFID
ncbi:hypothetical protein PsorP6_003867 [Peronosclerospora sorghi]|uniref:Uncharacterized protein n=1 Tax=Peronosclerospora sorghi TaxID=230839 RepID=A0ACC0VIF4_9STRA|nr:hypothetical protein PsorP6_003867 [Peronosclerospora sorghi]